MKDEGLAAEYRLFLGSAPMACVLTGNDAHAFSVDGEIDCRYGSRHDGSHFVWIEDRPELAGPLCDAEVDRLLSAGRIGLFKTDHGGECDDLPEAVHVAAFHLGARRASILHAWGRRMLRGERSATLDLPPTLVDFGSRHADDPATAVALYSFSPRMTAFSQGVRFGLAKAALGMDSVRGVAEAALEDHGRVQPIRLSRPELPEPGQCRSGRSTCSR